MQNQLKTSYNIFDKIRISFKIIKEMLEDRNENISLLNMISTNELFNYYDDDNVFMIKANDNIKIIYFINNKIKDINDIEKFIDNDDNDLSKSPDINTLFILE